MIFGSSELLDSLWSWCFSSFTLHLCFFFAGEFFLFWIFFWHCNLNIYSTQNIIHPSHPSSETCELVNFFPLLDFFSWCCWVSRALTWANALIETSKKKYIYEKELTFDWFIELSSVWFNFLVFLSPLHSNTFLCFHQRLTRGTWDVDVWWWDLNLHIWATF